VCAKRLKNRVRNFIIWLIYFENIKGIMKIKRIILIIACISVLLTGTFLTACAQNLPSHVQDLNYAESVEKINNPDQGFYRPIFVKVNEDGVSYNKNIVNGGTQLYHLRIDISAFSAAVNGGSDKILSQTALVGLKELLIFLRQKDKNAVVRFAYDPYYGGSKNKEPDIEMILKHIEQVCPILEEYSNTVTAIEAGLIGPWGEMHSSAIAKPEFISRIIQAFFDNTDDIPLLVRTPKMIYDYLGITVKDIASYRIAADTEAYRLGLFNDGYLGSGNDLGTYSDRDTEVEFLSNQTNHLPYGGEAVIPESKLHDIDVCLPEMNKLDLSYLNIEWNNKVIDKWKASYYTETSGTDEAYYGKTAFEYIENHFGYRFVLTRSDLKYPDLNYTDKLNEMGIELNLKNVGFGNLNRVKRTKIIITDENGETVFSKIASDFDGSERYFCSVKPELPKGKYAVYLRIYGEESDDGVFYCLRFANDGLWDENLKANKIGEIEF